VWSDGKKGSYEPKTTEWPDDKEDRPQPFEVQYVLWFLDESTYYANDCCKIRWSHEDKKAIPVAKGEGASLMVADFVSADYGWLWSPDGTKEA
jgi:hypothetical protein